MCTNAAAHTHTSTSQQPNDSQQGYSMSGMSTNKILFPPLTQHFSPFPVFQVSPLLLGSLFVASILIGHLYTRVCVFWVKLQESHDPHYVQVLQS